ncbi:hypothetical protein ACFL0S_04610 [Thermodesulfobacteriota bacterium]
MLLRFGYTGPDWPMLRQLGFTGLDWPMLLHDIFHLNITDRDQQRDSACDAIGLILQSLEDAQRPSSDRLFTAELTRPSAAVPGNLPSCPKLSYHFNIRKSGREKEGTK